MIDDDLMQNLPLSNDAKATGIASEILFYLVNEIKMNMFPKRVIPQVLIQQTIDEIEKNESKEQ